MGVSAQVSQSRLHPLMRWGAVQRQSHQARGAKQPRASRFAGLEAGAPPATGAPGAATSCRQRMSKRLLLMGGDVDNATMGAGSH